MTGDLAGKVIVLTEGVDGIGRECALACAREGASVAIHQPLKEMGLTAAEWMLEAV